MNQDEIDVFWANARIRANINPIGVITGPSAGEVLTPPAWSFGATEEQADELLDLVLRGIKTASASALWDYEAEDEPVPQVGDLSIILDGAGHPRALIRTTEVRVVPFNQVSEQHAYAEGEGDRSLNHWRTVHEWFLAEYASHSRGFTSDMPVVLEQFELLVPRPPQSPAGDRRL